jgi:hypothetical protein
MAVLHLAMRLRAPWTARLSVNKCTRRPGNARSLAGENARILRPTRGKDATRCAILALSGPYDVNCNGNCACIVCIDTVMYALTANSRSGLVLSKATKSNASSRFARDGVDIARASYCLSPTCLAPFDSSGTVD